MLVLTRKIGETVMIGDDVYLTILGVKGNQIRLGFDAPEDISIHRREIYVKIKNEKKVVNSSKDVSLLDPVKPIEACPFMIH